MPTASLADFPVGTEIGPSSWHLVDQARIDSFADATEDHQWLHIDPVRAAASSFKSTIAHGWLLLSLTASAVFELMPLEGGAVINYGADRVRFPASVPAGASVRASFVVTENDDLGTSRQVKLRGTVESDASAKPACVVDLIFREYPA